MKLSIIIPTIVERREQHHKLLDKFSDQLGKLPGFFDDGVTYSSFSRNCLLALVQFRNVGIEVISALDDKEISVGEKRDIAYSVANGKYAWMIDDDDDIAVDGIAKVLQAAKSDPDCITFQEHCMMDGVEKRSNFSLAYPDWAGEGHETLHDGFHFHRTPFFKTPIRTDLCRQVGVPHIRWGEDHQFARAIKPLLKTEIHIPEDIYFYKHTSSDSHTRYGFDKDEKK